MAQSGFGFWKILAILMVIVTIGNCAALTSAVDVVSESNRNTSPATSYMPEDYSLIRVGVNNVSLGDVIVVYNETYEENVTVNRRGALVVQMNNLTDSRTSVSGWETAKIITLLSTDTDSIQLISVTPPAGTTLQRGTVVPFEVTVDYNLESAATGFVGAELGLSTGRCVIMGREEVTQGHGTAVIRGSVDVDHLYDWLQSDTVYIALSLGYKIDPTHSILLIWKHMPDQYYFISSATPPIASFDYSWATFPESPKSGELITFDASSSEGTIVSYQWDFGDGETAEGRIVSHRFRGATNQPKTYTVNLAVKDNKGATDSDTSYVTVVPLEKAVEVTHRPAIPIPGQPVCARMTVSYNWIHDNFYVVSKIQCESEGFLGIATISIWDMHSHVIPTPVWATNIFSHGSKKEKTYYPKLVEIQYGGDTFEGIGVDAFDVMNIYFEGWAGISISEHPSIPLPNFFKTNSTCFEPDYTESPDLPIEAPDLELAYLCSPGELRVYDSQERVTGLVNGEIRNEIPNSSYSNNAIILLHSSDSYRYNVAGTEEGTYGLMVASIIEEVNNSFIAANISTTVGATHQYSVDWEALAQGEEGVTIQIDSDGDGTFEQNITTDDTFYPPIASFFPTTLNPAVGEEITFNAASSNDLDGTITKYEWNFGDGNIKDTPEPIITHSYASIGEYTVDLTVTDDEGATGTNTTTITVLNPPDLEITAKWVCWPDNCTICYNVTNTGDGTAPACHNTTLYVDGVVVAHDHVPVVLAPGESYIGCFDGYTWTYTPPSDNITVCADNSETLDEFDEDNNCMTNIWMCGDVTGDGRVRTSDGRRIFRHLTFGVPIDNLWAADVTGDGRVRTSDGRRIFRHLTFGVPLNCNCSG